MSMYSPETESGDLIASATFAVNGAQADHDAAATPNARAVTLLRLRAAQGWMSELLQELGRSEAMADTAPLVQYHRRPAPAPWMGTALILDNDDTGPLVTRAASGALIVGNPPDAR